VRSRFLFAALLLVPVCLPAASLKVRIGSTILEMGVEEYVAAVLAGECATFRSDEAIKAMAVAARSYALHLRGRHASQGFDLCSTTHCQRLDRAGVTPRLTALGAQTAGEILWFEGKPALASYSRSCGGRTEDGSAVWGDLRAPYLKSHDDPYCRRQSDPGWRWSAGPAEIAEALHKAQLRAPAEIRGVTVLRRTASGRARELALEGPGESVRVAASSFRFAIGRALGFQTLRSDQWQLVQRGDRLEFAGSGEGHGAGLCQLGAQQMGAEGHGYREILAFYYAAAQVGLTARGLDWQRYSGERVSLMGTGNREDSAVLAIADRLTGEIAAKYNWAPPVGIEIRVYPDLDTFRNATGEPGWVAARTSARHIELQPAAMLRARGVLESTLRHELLHVFVEAQAVGGLPLWFREGLVGFLEGAPSLAGKSGSADAQQKGDQARAHRAYAANTAQVAELVRRSGREAVLGWVRSGLPPEVQSLTRP